MILKFLLIDDDPDDRDLFCEAIYAVDNTIVCYTASGGRKALAKLDNLEIEFPDIIFLDINMPGMNGWQCLSILKEHQAYKKIPVVLYSTTCQKEDVEKAQNSGALYFFTKPTSFNDLKRCMEIVVGHLQQGSLSSLIADKSFTPMFS